METTERVSHLADAAPDREAPVDDHAEEHHEEDSADVAGSRHRLAERLSKCDVFLRRRMTAATTTMAAVT